PVFTKHLNDIEVEDSSNVTFSVSFDGLPQPSIAWYFNEELLKSSADFFIDTDQTLKESRLVIKELFPDDEGTYICKAVNLLGTAVT
ncbi:hypothetical protein HELRODRAFT_137829, partial [Helobdella robusta]|uniref:Ig-like domain-containing protein n=1 Tax=Helobdella robusta TaxID=6412 RepID=T1EIN8_HELRO